MKPAEYLVQLKNGTLYYYDRLDILLCHLAMNRPEEVRVFKRADSGFVIRYVPTTEAELRGKVA